MDVDTDAKRETNILTRQQNYMESYPTSLKFSIIERSSPSARNPPTTEPEMNR